MNNEFGAGQRTGTPLEILLFRIERLNTPIGEMLILTDDEDMVRAIDWCDYEARMHLLLRRQYRASEVCIRSGKPASSAAITLRKYFDGDLGCIAALGVRTGGTAFQNRIWRALRDIPAGQTRSYGLLASQLGTAGASRAVGFANGANPVGIVIPRHRVIGATGRLTGYGGGLERKRWLLRHEGAAFDREDA